MIFYAMLKGGHGGMPTLALAGTMIGQEEIIP
jgi:hypothetical protein